MKSSTLAVLLAIALAAPLVATRAADVPTLAVPLQVQATGGYLGVLLGPVPDALRAQLGDVLPPGQGVMIRDVAKDSPAAKAGLKAYDILIRYDDQKVFSAEQLSHLVRADSPDKAVTLQLVRNGTAQDVQVMLGQAQAQAAGESGYPELGMHVPRMPGYVPGPSLPLPGAVAGNWDSFDSMSLKKLEDGNFKAEIRFLGKDGKLVKQEFTGTRDAIREQILEQMDLPPAERYQLLSALSARDPFFAAPPPPDWFLPRSYLPPWFNWQPGF